MAVAGFCFMALGWVAAVFCISFAVQVGEGTQSAGAAAVAAGLATVLFSAIGGYLLAASL